MKVKVKHYNLLIQKDCQSISNVDIRDGASIEDLLLMLGLQVEEIGIIVVNGKETILGEKLQDNDLVALIPHIGGG